MRSAAALAVGTLFATLPACSLLGGPDYEHIANDLRDRNLKLQQDLDKSQRQLKDANATIVQMQSASPPVATLPADRLDQLLLADRVEIRAMTSTADLHHDGKVNGFRVMFRPLAQDGTVIPETGAVSIEAFDLSIKTGDNRLGAWSFAAAELKGKWYGGLGLSHFAVDCPWTHPPTGPDVTFTLKFTDALTGRTFTDQKIITIHNP